MPGFQRVERIPTAGKPGIFATLDADAPRTVGVYFMYDVKQVDPKEWASPPWDAVLVDKLGLGSWLAGSGAHAPDEYYVIESRNPKVVGFDGAAKSFVNYLYELAGK